MDAAGGGGYGDPKERDPEILVRDIADGRVSQGGAVRDYALK
jgi:N-methylhydantoinase B/oxoprolinase/acetone carboxylase alpha subunit